MVEDGAAGAEAPSPSSPGVPPSRLSSAIYQATRDSVQKQKARQGHQPSKRHFRPPAGGLLTRCWQGTISIVKDTLELVFRPFSGLCGVIRDHFKIAAAIAVLCLMVPAAMWLQTYWWTDAGVYAELQAIHNEFEQLRSSSASELQWNDFNQRANAACLRIRQRLTASANSDRSARLIMLRAARDYLPAMLKDARQSPSDSEALFTEHIRNAGQLVGSSRRASGGTDWMTIAVIAFDGLLILVSGLWFLRRA